MPKDSFRFGILPTKDCGVKEIKALTELHSVFFTGNVVPLSVTDIKLACRHHYVFVARERVTGEPIVGMLIFIRKHLFDGPVGVIECPMLAKGYEVLSHPLFAKAIDFANKQGIMKIELPHQVFGVTWQHRQTLRDLGFQSQGAHLYVLNYAPKVAE